MYLEMIEPELIVIYPGGVMAVPLQIFSTGSCFLSIVPLISDATSACGGTTLRHFRLRQRFSTVEFLNVGYFGTHSALYAACYLL